MTVSPSPDTPPVRKFMFDVSFDNAPVVHRAPERKPVLMKPEQIDEMKQQVYDVAYEAGKTAGQSKQNAELTVVLSGVEHNIATLIKNLEGIAADQQRITRQLVLAIAKKILPHFTAQNGVGEIEALLSDTLRDMMREPRLVVRVEETQFDRVNEKVQAIATQCAYPGKVIVLSDPDVAAGDCRIEWADGGVERNTQTVWHDVELTLDPSSP